MLNPWLAITFQAMRLGFEAQNAVTLRVMRLVGAAHKTEVRSMITDKAAAPLDAHEAPIKVAPDSHKRRKAVTKGRRGDRMTRRSSSRPSRLQ